MDILSWGWGYKVISFNEDTISFGVDNNSDEPSQVDISGKTPGKTYPVFRDKYYQEYTMSVNVTDATLDIHLPPDLSVVGNNVIFDNYNPQYISATNFHTDVNYTKSNNNIRVTKEIIDDDLIAFLITPVENGETTLTFVDAEKNEKDEYVNKKEYVIQVWWDDSIVEEEDDITSENGIRYIRDWANGSNSNLWNFWVEIEALEKATGNNIAQWKNVTGSIPENTSKPYSRITDGQIGNNSYFYSHPSTYGERWYVEVDLWGIYDIDSVKILHYYTDGRTFKETKTEVSADGITWTTLFDSATEGTYAEPRDGRGRTYEVRVEWEDNELGDDVQNLLNEIFSDADIEYSEIQSIDWVEINRWIWENKDDAFDKIELWLKQKGWSDQKITDYKIRLTNFIERVLIDVHPVRLSRLHDSVLEKQKENRNGQDDIFLEWILELIEYSIPDFHQDYYERNPPSLDATRHIRNFNTLSESDKQDYFEWIQDTLTLNGMYEAAWSLALWYWASEITKQIITSVWDKHGKKVAFKLSLKAFPYIGTAVLIAWFASAWDENLDYYVYCASDLGGDYEWRWPMYYCWKLIVNWVFSAWWVALSRANVKWIFKKTSFIQKIKYNDSTLQKKYNSHAADFWITANYNLQNRKLFQDRLDMHVASESTIMIEWTHRTTQKVQHFYNKDTGINVMYELDGTFVSWWKLYPSQLNDLLNNKNVR